MSFIGTSSIDVFPYSKIRVGKEYPNIDRVLYEQHLANLTRQAISMDAGKSGIILSKNASITFENNTYTFVDDFEFNIWGYYFRIAKGTSVQLDTSGKYLIASIELTQVIPGLYNIIGADVDNKFQGLSLSASDSLPNSSGNVYSLVLAERKGQAVGVYTSNASRISSAEINLVMIDGKVE